jgi:hypothetical protein
LRFCALFWTWGSSSESRAEREESVGNLEALALARTFLVDSDSNDDDSSDAEENTCGQQPEASLTTGLGNSVKVDMPLCLPNYTRKDPTPSINFQDERSSVTRIAFRDWGVVQVGPSLTKGDGVTVELIARLNVLNEMPNYVEGRCDELVRRVAAGIGVCEASKTLGLDSEDSGLEASKGPPIHILANCGFFGDWRHNGEKESRCPASRRTSFLSSFDSQNHHEAWVAGDVLKVQFQMDTGLLRMWKNGVEQPSVRVRGRGCVGEFVRVGVGGCTPPHTHTERERHMQHFYSHKRTRTYTRTRSCTHASPKTCIH